MRAQLRKDPVVNRWVVIDPNREEREAVFRAEEGLPPQRGICPFCPGNEEQTPKEIFALGEPGRRPNQAGWWVRVIPDKAPILKIEEEIDRRPEGMFDFMTAVGAHEIVVETPQHAVEWPQLDDAHLEGILRTYRARSLDLRNDRRFRQVMVVKNHGRSVSRYEHPHSHVIAFPIVPKGIDEEVQGCLDFFRRKERCIYCDILREERQMQRRVIFASKDFCAIAPFASRFPFETWIIPTRHTCDFWEIRSDEVRDLARVLKATLGGMLAVLPRVSCSLILHTSPLNDFRREEYHWHLELIPKLLKAAGFEWGTGFFVNPIPPEEAAASLRGDKAPRGGGWPPPPLDR